MVVLGIIDGLLLGDEVMKVDGEMSLRGLMVDRRLVGEQELMKKGVDEKGTTLSEEVGEKANS